MGKKAAGSSKKRRADNASKNKTLNKNYTAEKNVNKVYNEVSDNAAKAEADGETGKTVSEPRKKITIMKSKKAVTAKKNMPYKNGVAKASKTSHTAVSSAEKRKENRKNNEEREHRVKKGAIVALAVVFALVAVACTFAYNDAKTKEEIEKIISTDTIYSGIAINGVDMGGLSPESAEDKLEKEINSIFDDIKIKISSDDEIWEYKFSDFGTKYDFKEAISQAYKYGREGSEKERYEAVKDLENKPKNFEGTYSYNKELVAEKLQEVDAEVSYEAKNSMLSRENGRFSISDEAEGYKMDIEKMVTAVCEAIETKDNAEIKVVGDIVEPLVTREDNEKATNLIGTFYTSFSGGPGGRNENLRVGCQNINGTVVEPGEVYSMNKSLGPQTYANGYVDAGVIVDGKIENGVAGGVCQITTTLYNAVIRAELEIVERANHSLMVGYVPIGMDSAVAGDFKDLKFRNNTDYPVYIEAYTTDNKIICNLYGYEIHDAGRKIEFESQVDSTISKPEPKITYDPEMPEGTEEITSNGKVGKIVSTYKIVYENGVLESREFFSTSKYSATADEITMGTKKAEDETVTPESGSILSSEPAKVTENTAATQ